MWHFGIFQNLYKWKLWGCVSLLLSSFLWDCHFCVCRGSNLFHPQKQENGALQGVAIECDIICSCHQWHSKCGWSTSHDLIICWHCNLLCLQLFKYTGALAAGDHKSDFKIGFGEQVLLCHQHPMCILYSQTWYTPFPHPYLKDIYWISGPYFWQVAALT